MMAYVLTSIARFDNDPNPEETLHGVFFAVNDKTARLRVQLLDLAHPERIYRAAKTEVLA